MLSTSSNPVARHLLFCAVLGVMTQISPAMAQVSWGATSSLQFDVKNLPSPLASNLLATLPTRTEMTFVDLPTPARDALLQKISQVAGNKQPAPSSSELQGKIIGGTEVLPGQFAWQAALIYSAFNDENRVQFCGGTMVSPTVIVSAAHCFKGKDGEMGADEVDVVVGTVNYADVAQGERIRIKEVHLHPQYNMTTFQHDVAVLVLARAAQFGSPIALYGAAQERHPLPVGQMLYISGWGVTSNGSATKQLQWAPVPTASSATCNATEAYSGAVKDDMICAGFPAGRIDACQGDSGGPAVFAGTNLVQRDPVLYGVVSWGARGKCAQAKKLGVYSAITPHLDWLKGFLP